MNINITFNEPILAVDDELVNLKLIDKALSKEGYTNITLIQDPRKVVETYLRIRPSLILLDLNMPHYNGFEVIEQLKALNDNVLAPIVILTAQSQREYRIKGLAEGADDFLTKPLDIDVLKIRVRNLITAHIGNKFLQDCNSELEDLVAQRTREVDEQRLQVIRRLGLAAEYRDPETGEHIIRMSHYSEKIAERLGWSKQDRRLMLYASPLHDVGKIGIPDEILLKPGKLTEEERTTMEEHPEIGAKLLSDDDSDLMVMARDIALCHHEKWDGTGYPYGLKGSNIPESARIVAVSDVFDALTSERPYKKAWPVEDAIDLIKKDSGKHFDPCVVEAFLGCLDEILKIKDWVNDKSSAPEHPELKTA